MQYRGLGATRGWGAEVRCVGLKRGWGKERWQQRSTCHGMQKSGRAALTLSAANSSSPEIACSDEPAPARSRHLPLKHPTPPLPPLPNPHPNTIYEHMTPAPPLPCTPRPTCRHEHGGPVDSVEAEDILADDVHAGGPAAGQDILSRGLHTLRQQRCKAGVNGWVVVGGWQGWVGGGGCGVCTLHSLYKV